jgi:hypothetical protein
MLSQIDDLKREKKINHKHKQHDVYTSRASERVKHWEKRKRYIFHSPPKGGGLLRRSAFSATLTGRFGMGTVRMGAEGGW